MTQFSTKIKFHIKIGLQKIIFLFLYTFYPLKNKKIIIGTTEIGNVLFNLKDMFNDKCICVCKNKNKFYTANHYDHDFSNKKGLLLIIISAFYFGLLAKNARLFIYIGNEGFLIDREPEFQFLKKHSIPIICIFLGSDIRSPKLFRQYCNEIGFNTYIDYLGPHLLSDVRDTEKKKLAEQADKYAAMVFSHKIDQYSYITKPQYFFPPVINENIFLFNHTKHASFPIRILHAPSSPVIKGTPVIRCVIKQLKNEGFIFDYVELNNMPHEKVIYELNLSHIVINQLYSFIPGIFGLEAMATCNAVLMSAKHENFPYPFNNAWMETEDWQLYNNLKLLLNNPKKIVGYAKNGFEYVQNNFSRIAVMNYLNKVFTDQGLSLVQ